MKSISIILETPRLILREVLPEDIEGFLRLDADPEVHRYLGNKPISDRKKLEEIINYVRQQYIDNGIGRWAVEHKITGEFMGWSGLKLVKEELNNHINYYDLGYRFIKEFWGQGYATESATAVMNYGFDVLGLKEVFAAAHTQNQASNKILKKLNFKHIECFYFENELNNWYHLERVPKC